MQLSSSLLSLCALRCFHIPFVVNAGDIPNDLSVPDADLICQNGSLLTEGVDRYEIFPIEMLNEFPFLQETQRNGKFCQCGETVTGFGYTGIDCTIHYEMCKDDKTICFNGAPCVQDFTDNEKYHCACPQTTDPVHKFEGKSCEYQVTSYCEELSDPTNIEDDDLFLTVPYDVSASGEWYCTNGADCQSGIMRPSEKCDCTDNFYGLHCEQREEQPCDFTCLNGGVCKNGVKDYTNLSNSLQEHFEPDAQYDTHCICPTGFTGRQCEIDTSNCGSKKCLNGGTCGARDMCDCTDAKTKNGPLSGAVLAFAGSSCESKVTSFCTVPSGFDQISHFCTNDGKCPKDYAENFGACECGADHIGPRCEFTVQNAQVCDLQCQNGGTCFFGETSKAYDEPFVFHNKDDQIHCKCPDGYIGDLCEIEVCGANEHFCLNTGTCIEKNDSYSCECAANGTDGVYAGANCQYAASTFCGSLKDKLHSFCTNEGTCKSIVDELGEHPGCECKDGYTGNYCEIDKSDEDSKSKHNAFGKVLWILLTIFLTLSVSCWTIICSCRARNKNTQDHTPIDNPMQDDPEHSDNNMMNMEEIQVDDYNPYDDTGEIVLNVQIT